MAFPAIKPIYTYTDIDGRPLDDGYLYYGVANLDPEANPITVYWDAAETQPAAQPIRTIGGYAVNAGVRAIVYAPSNYSVNVRNKNGSLVSTSPSELNDNPFYSDDGASGSLWTTVQGFISKIISPVGSSVVGFIQAGVGAVMRTVQDKLRETVSVTDFGAVGDGVTDDTAAIQAAFDSGADGIGFPPGTFLVGNLTLPNNQCTIYGEAMWKTRIKASLAALSTDNYLIASPAYVNNSTSGSVQVIIRDLWIDGDNIVENPLVIYSFWTEINRCRIQKPKNAGAALLMTSQGISGSNCATTLVENKVINCRLDGAGSVGGFAFRMLDTTARCTDMVFEGNLAYNGIASFTTMAGHNVSNNHFYGGSVEMNRLSNGTVIANNYYENTLVLNDFKDQVVGLVGNRFLGRVTVSFGADGRVCTFDSCIWSGAADLYHNFFGSNKDIIVNGGSFETATPVVFSNGASTGWVRFSDVWSYVDQKYLIGSRQAAINSIRATLQNALSVSADRGDADITFIWLSSNTTQRFDTALTANRTVTVSTTNAVNGAKARFIRTGGGAFTLDVGGLKTLAAGQWCDIEYNGAAWSLTSFGAL